MKIYERKLFDQVLTVSTDSEEMIARHLYGFSIHLKESAGTPTGNAIVQVKNNEEDDWHDLDTQALTGSLDQLWNFDAKYHSHVRLRIELSAGSTTLKAFLFAKGV